MSRLTPENRGFPGGADSDPERLMTEAEALARHSNQIRKFRDEAGDLVTLLMDPLVKKIVERHGRDPFLRTLKDAQTKGRSFLEAVSLIDETAATASIAIADLFYERLSATAVDRLAAQLRETGESPETLEQRLSREAEEALLPLRHAARRLQESVDAADDHSLTPSNLSQRVRRILEEALLSSASHHYSAHRHQNGNGRRNGRNGKKGNLRTTPGA